MVTLVQATMAASKKPKLPASLKVDVYANVVAASADLIVAGCNSAPKVSAWSPSSGTVIVDKPFMAGMSFRAGPMAAGLATLPGNRFVQSGRPVNYDKQYPGSLAVFGLDGAAVGEVRTGDFDACATSPAGDLVAVSTVAGMSLWRTDDLIGGGKPIRTLEKLEMSALCFTPDGKSIVFVTDNRLTTVAVDSGKVVEHAASSCTPTAEVVSVSDDGVVCVSDQSSAALITTAGKTVFQWPRLSASKVLPVELAMITPDGVVIAVAGPVGKHYARDWAAKAKFPDTAMADGFVAVLDPKGKLQQWRPRAKKQPARAMALSVGRAVVIGQDGGAELAPWPV